MQQNVIKYCYAAPPIKLFSLSLNFASYIFLFAIIFNFLEEVIPFLLNFWHAINFFYISMLPLSLIFYRSQ